MSEAAMIFVPTDISEKVREIEVAYARYLEEFRIPDDHKIVVNFSAGKDSTTTATVAHHLFGDRVQNVMADTDNEHDLTVDFARNIHLQIGCKPVQIVKRIYTDAEFERRRKSLMKRWPKKQAIRMGAYRGVIMPSLARSDTKFGQAWLRTAERWGIEFETTLDAALSVMHPSGNSFLDAALLHGKFPMMRDRFCTDELKIQIAFDAAIKPLLDDGEVSFSGLVFALMSQTNAQDMTGFHVMSVTAIFSITSYPSTNGRRLMFSPCINISVSSQIHCTCRGLTVLAA